LPPGFVAAIEWLGVARGLASGLRRRDPSGCGYRPRQRSAAPRRPEANPPATPRRIMPMRAKASRRRARRVLWSTAGVPRRGVRRLMWAPVPQAAVTG